MIGFGLYGLIYLDLLLVTDVTFNHATLVTCHVNLLIYCRHAVFILFVNFHSIFNDFTKYLYA